MKCATTPFGVYDNGYKMLVKHRKDEELTYERAVSFLVLCALYVFMFAW